MTVVLLSTNRHDTSAEHSEERQARADASPRQPNTGSTERNRATETSAGQLADEPSPREDATHVAPPSQPPQPTEVATAREPSLDQATPPPDTTPSEAPPPVDAEPSAGTELAEDWSTDADAWETGQHACWKGDFATAERLLRSVPESHPSYAEARRYLGYNVAVRGRRNPLSGLPALHESFAANPLNPSIWEDLPRAYWGATVQVLDIVAEAVVPD